MAKYRGFTLHAEERGNQICMTLRRERRYQGTQCGRIPRSPHRPVSINPDVGWNNYAAAIAGSIRTAEIEYANGRRQRVPTFGKRGFTARFVILPASPPDREVHPLLRGARGAARDRRRAGGLHRHLRQPGPADRRPRRGGDREHGGAARGVAGPARPAREPRVRARDHEHRGQRVLRLRQRERGHRQGQLRWSELRRRGRRGGGGGRAAHARGRQRIGVAGARPAGGVRRAPGGRGRGAGGRGRRGRGGGRCERAGGRTRDDRSRARRPAVRG